jgi:hypothetical protein
MLSRFLLTALALAPLSPAPGLPTSADTRLEGEALAAAIEELATLVSERYVFPEDGARIAARLRERLWEGAYEDVALEALCRRLTGDLQSVNGDRHLNAYPLPADAGERPDPETLRLRQAEQARQGNHGFERVEILPGNVGLLVLNGFADAAVAGDTARGAMAFLANVDALVIDLRQNGGGDPSMIQLLCSHFFAERTLLNTFEWRGREGREEYWTTTEVAEKKLVDVPLFVLTSRGTFSAAEEFAYDLRCLERARLFGERSGGGAHPGDVHPVAGVLQVFVPNGRAINPLTGTNWEGVGVEPHVEVPAEKALDAALVEARAAAAKQRESRPR